VRLAVYTDYVYRREDGAVFAERAFALFVARLADHLDGVTIVGRLDPRPGRSHYRLPEGVEFVALPHYTSVLDLRSSLPAMAGSLVVFWRVLRRVEGAWLLGPNLLSMSFAVLAAARGRRVALGVRQDTPTYVRTRHPTRRWFHVAADLIEGLHRLMARRWPIVVVGPHIARNYARGTRVLPIAVSLVGERDLVPPEEALARDYGGPELVALSVGRIEREKNPLLLADVLAAVRERDPRWRLVVCGEGPMMDELRERLESLGVAEHADLRGYVPIDGELPRLYRSSHALLHVSWTEGVPQVLFEAYAAGLPVVATAVGGVADAAGDAALLVPPGEVDPPADALARVGAEPDLRRRLVEAGAARVREHTTEAESRRVAEFLSGG
jgi:glycosyltransferase involved in cell wall biosynthesis